MQFYASIPHDIDYVKCPWDGHGTDSSWLHPLEWKTGVDIYEFTEKSRVSKSDLDFRGGFLMVDNFDIHRSIHNHNLIHVEPISYTCIANGLPEIKINIYIFRRIYSSKEWATRISGNMQNKKSRNYMKLTEEASETECIFWNKMKKKWKCSGFVFVEWSGLRSTQQITNVAALALVSMLWWKDSRPELVSNVKVFTCH